MKKVAKGQEGNTQDKILSSIVLESIGSHQEILSPRLITCCSRYTIVLVKTLAMTLGILQISGAHITIPYKKQWKLKT